MLYMVHMLYMLHMVYVPHTLCSMCCVCCSYAVYDVFAVYAVHARLRLRSLLSDRGHVGQMQHKDMHELMRPRSSFSLKGGLCQA